MNLIYNSFFSKKDLKKFKTLLLIFVFTVVCFNVFAQTSSLVSSCSDFDAGPNATWPYVLEATTPADSAASQAAQTYTMNIISLPAGGANVRVYKTVANGNVYLGNPVALTLGSNSITVAAVTFDRAVKFQFSSGDVEFDALSLNGVNTNCISPQPMPSSILISACSDFDLGPNATWPYVLVATTPADSAASQAAQTYTMNIISLPVGGANMRVYKTVANGNVYLGNPVALTLGSNSITVAAVTFDRAVKFQFSSGDVEFDALSLNGINTNCISPLPTPTSSIISACSDFIIGPSAWPYVLVATTIADGVVSQGAQTFTMNVTSLPAGGANVRVYKTTANGSNFFGNPVALTLGSNSITVAAVTFDRAVKFQFSSGDVEFDALSLNGINTNCVCTTTFSTDTVIGCDSYTWIDGNTYNSSNNTATHTLINAAGCDSIVNLDLTITSTSSDTDIVEACDSYTWIDGNTYTSSNNSATHTLTNAAGCDSIVNLDLTITIINTAVNIVNDSMLQAQSVATGTTYQWVDCNNNFTPIAGETNLTFTPQVSGSYAVEINLNNCSDISDCFTINSTLNIDDLETDFNIKLFPNPATNDINISLDAIELVEIVILDIQGKVLLQQSGIFLKERINLSSYQNGTYFLKILTTNGTRNIRFSKQ